MNDRITTSFDPRDPRRVPKGMAPRVVQSRKESGMFNKAFVATMGVLVALTVWIVVSGAISVIVWRLLER